MKTSIILLRGVMPTGKNRVPMAPLRAALAKAGLEDVRTYIQSGNVIAASRRSPRSIATLVHDVIAQEFGGDIVVFVRTPAQMRDYLERMPFRNPDTKRLYFTLLADSPDPALLAALAAEKHGRDRFQVVGDMLYLYYAARYSDSKLNNNYLERRLKLSATTRNFNTMTKLVELTRE